MVGEQLLLRLFLPRNNADELSSHPSEEYTWPHNCSEMRDSPLASTISCWVADRPDGQLCEELRVNVRIFFCVNEPLFLLPQRETEELSSPVLQSVVSGGGGGSRTRVRRYRRSASTSLVPCFGLGEASSHDPDEAHHSFLGFRRASESAEARYTRVVDAWLKPTGKLQQTAYS